VVLRQFFLGLVLAVVAGTLGAADKPQAKPSAPAATPSASTNAEVVAYYFHGTIRCETCLKIEKQAREAIEWRFPSEMAAKRLVFKSVNYEEPEDAHYLKDYKLPCPSLVLLRQRGGREQDWKVLGQTWEMVHIPPKLDQYIEEETRKFLEGSALGVPASPAPVNSNGVASVQPQKVGAGKAIRALAEMDTLASEMNAVFVVVPAKDAEPTTADLAAIEGAKRSLEARFEIKIGLFTLLPGSRDYGELAGQMSLPGVVAIVKTGVRRCISGELTQDRIVEGFMVAVGAGGCCPLGYPSEER
jgi:hypothetical protein